MSVGELIQLMLADTNDLSNLITVRKVYDNSAVQELEFFFVAKKKMKESKVECASANLRAE